MAEKIEQDASERFFDLWRQMRRGEVVRLINPLFQNVTDPPLTSNEADLLQALATQPGGLGMSDLALLTIADPGNLTRTITALIHRGLVERSRGDVDGRERFVKLTEKAQLLAQQHSDLRRHIFHLATQRLSSADQAQMLESLETVFSSLRDLGLDPSALGSLAQPQGA